MDPVTPVTPVAAPSAATGSRRGPVSPAEAARPASVADRDELLRMATAARDAMAEARGGHLLSVFDEPSEALVETIERATSGVADRAAWIGTLDAVPVGYALATIERLSDDTSLAVLHELYVEPEAREVGVGEAVLAQVIAWATACGCGGIDARALPGDRATKNFYEAAGLVARSIVVHADLPPIRRPTRP